MDKHPSTNGSYDTLTQIKDRTSFVIDTQKYAAKGIHAHIVLVQLSQLLRINRKYGILVCDKLIYRIAQYLQALRPDYEAYRIANSRLVLLGPECCQEQANALIAEIQKRFESTWTVSHDNHTYGISTKAYFIHLFMELDDTENDLMDKMNHAISIFPNKEKDGIVFFDQEINADLRHLKYIMEELRYAIDHKTFTMYYQPIFDCHENKFTSAESLIRLNGRDGSFISPGEFIPMAEDTGLIDGISWIVLEKVCHFLGSHPDLPLKTVSINMTGQQILDPSFIQRVEESLEKNHLDGSCLRIEITERTIIEDFAEVKKVMKRLSDMGIHFYLDDFGTGYSNLSSMFSLPFEVIKFDQSLMKTITETNKALKTIGLLADIMHENEYYIVAEGIETETQARTAHECRLDRIQGYYFSKPLPEDELVKFLKENS